MKTAHAAAIQWSTNQFSSGIEVKLLLQGEAGARDNFDFSFVRIASGYSAERRRQNFDQLCFGIEGATNYAPGKELKAGDVGYIPEGTLFGPLKNAAASAMLRIRLGGASGQGYQENENGADRAAPRFEEPIVMHPENFGWRAIGGGFDFKHLGTFGEHRLEVGFIRGPRGATHMLGALPSPELALVTKGAFAVENRVGEKLDKHSAWYVDARDQGTKFEVLEDTEFFLVRMPTFS